MYDVTDYQELVSNVISFKYSETYLRFHDEWDSKRNSLVMIPTFYLDFLTG